MSVEGVIIIDVTLLIIVMLQRGSDTVLIVIDLMSVLRSRILKHFNID